MLCNNIEFHYDRDNTVREYQLLKIIGLKKLGLISLNERTVVLFFLRYCAYQNNLPRRFEKEEMCAFRNIVWLFSTWNNAFNF